MSSNQKVFLRLKNRTKHKKSEYPFDDKIFTFNGILYASQIGIFKSIAQPLINDFIKGYNCTLLAYGQTGSGKTYTIQGTDNDVGIIQRTIYHIFKVEGIESVSITYIEIYNESIYDLFYGIKNNKEELRRDINIREDIDRGITLENITQVLLTSYEDFQDKFSLGNVHRKTAQTKMNIESSRSHAIFTIHLKTREGNMTLKRKFHIVDLAGSERIGQLYSDERQKETGNINKSLLCLGTVIEKLSKKDQHINFRDSKLTFMLKDCLGVNTKLVVIGTIKNNLIDEEIQSSSKLNQSENKENKQISIEDTQIIPGLGDCSGINNMLQGVKDKRRVLYDTEPRKKQRSENYYEILNTLKFLDRVKCIESNAMINTLIEGDIAEIKQDYKELYLKYLELKEEKGMNLKDDSIVTQLPIKSILKRMKTKLSILQTDLDSYKDKLEGYIDKFIDNRKCKIIQSDEKLNK